MTMTGALGRGSRAILAAAWAAVLASGCVTPEFVIEEPADGGSVDCHASGGTCQVGARVDWRGAAVHVPDLYLDGTLVPNALASRDKDVYGVLSMAPGAHTIEVFGQLSDGRSIHNYSASSSFTVKPPPVVTGGFTLMVAPTAITVERGMNATATVTVARTAPFTGPIAVAVSGLPAGVTTTQVDIAAGQTTGTLTVTAGLDATFGVTRLTVNGDGGAMVSSETKMLNLRVGRTTGSFTEADPAPYIPNMEQSGQFSLTKNYSVTLLNADGRPEPLQASFFNGDPQEGDQIGESIGVRLGQMSTLGGGGFCDDRSTITLPRGVVMSSTPMAASQYRFTFVDLTGSVKARFELAADGIAAHPVMYTFTPRVFFSPDCTLALVAGVNVLGPWNYVIHVMDLITGVSVGEVNFNTTDFAANVKMAGGNQQVEVTVDTGTQMLTLP